MAEHGQSVIQACRRSLDDLPRRPAGLPRFVAEDQMAQLESEAARALLPDAITRHLVVS